MGQITDIDMSSIAVWELVQHVALYIQSHSIATGRKRLTLTPKTHSLCTTIMKGFESSTGRWRPHSPTDDTNIHSTLELAPKNGPEDSSGRTTDSLIDHVEHPKNCLHDSVQENEPTWARTMRLCSTVCLSLILYGKHVIRLHFFTLDHFLANVFFTSQDLRTSRKLEIWVHRTKEGFQNKNYT